MKFVVIGRIQEGASLKEDADEDHDNDTRTVLNGDQVLHERSCDRSRFNKASVFDLVRDN